MKLAQTLFSWSLLFGILLLAGCAVPQHFWPQKDIIASSVNNMPGNRTVLIASRASEYKEQLVAELQNQLSAANISHMAIGVKQLDQVDTSDYAAVVIINTCLAWGLDHEVRNFLDRQKAYGNIILFTTSGDGSWLPDKHGRGFDAVSGASVKAGVSDVASDLLKRIQTKL